MKKYYKVFMLENEKEGYLCVNDIASIFYESGYMFVRLRDEKIYAVNRLDMATESEVDLQKVIHIEGSDEVYNIPLEVINYVKSNPETVDIRELNDYVPSRVYLGLLRMGITDFVSLASRIESGDLLKGRYVGNWTAQKAIDLCLVFDFVERKTDKDYKPLEGYVSKLTW